MKLFLKLDQRIQDHVCLLLLERSLHQHLLSAPSIMQTFSSAFTGLTDTNVSVRDLQEVGATVTHLDEQSKCQCAM